ncbi:MAG: SufE family protein [Candidatus Cloacimonetes bacterium]|nr:SufE family protein [Candidatus Cloacimonadota bacterium]
MKIKENQDIMIKEFTSLNGWLEKYEYLIDMGKKLPEMDKKHKTQENLVSGCQSQLWITAELVNDKLVIFADSDAMITKGIIAMVLSFINNHTPKEIYDSHFSFLDEMGLTTNLSPSRVNGLKSIIKRINELCLSYM